MAASAESVVGANADLITDFSHAQGDRIDLSAIDANTGVAGNQAFSFIGTGLYTGVAGQLRYAAAGGVTTIAGDVNGDGASDFHIQLTGAIAPGRRRLRAVARATGGRLRFAPAAIGQHSPETQQPPAARSAHGCRQENTHGGLRRAPSRTTPTAARRTSDYIAGVAGDDTLFDGPALRFLGRGSDLTAAPGTTSSASPAGPTRSTAAPAGIGSSSTG